MIIMIIGTVLSLLFLIWLNRVYKRKHLSLLPSTQLDPDTHADEIALAYEPPQSYLVEVKKGRDVGKGLTEDEMEELENRTWQERPTEKASDLFCFAFNKCVPLRAACEQMFEICCWGFLDNLLSYL
jgi:hypothetical protein